VHRTGRRLLGPWPVCDQGGDGGTDDFGQRFGPPTSVRGSVAVANKKFIMSSHTAGMNKANHGNEFLAPAALGW
jgi:hypothetical protein